MQKEESFSRGDFALSGLEATTGKVGRLKYNWASQTVRETSFCWQNAEISLTFRTQRGKTAALRAHYKKKQLFLRAQCSGPIRGYTKLSFCTRASVISTKLVGPQDAGSLQGEQVIRMHATAKPHMQWHI